MNKIFSIIIPTFNSSKHIDQCLSSLKNQTLKNFEVIVIDDLSNDNTIDIVLSYSKYLDIKILKTNGQNIIGYSRNLGIREAKYDWIAFLDSDDFWDKNKIKCVSEHIYKYDLIYHDTYLINNNSSKLLKVGEIKKPLLKNYLVTGNTIYPSSLLIKKQILKEVNYFNESKNMMTSEDYNLLLKVFEYTENICYLKLPLTKYKIHKENSSKKIFDWSISFRNSIKDFIYILNNQERCIKKAEIIYLKYKYFIILKKYNRLEKLLFYCLKYGSINIKLRSIFQITKLYFIKRI